MAAKSLSTSTLSLRFMQNANRAKQLKEVELERAEVKDDEKWEVSQAVRDSWGTNSNVQSESLDIHETSYLPFLFSGSDLANDVIESEPSIKLTGRRVFNKKGELVTSTASSSAKDTVSTTTTPTTTPTTTTTETAASSAMPTTRKVHSRPVSISAAMSSHSREQSKNKGRNPKSARDAIFQNLGVGTDLRSEMRKGQSGSTTATSTFMKPAGVDDPKDIKAEPYATLNYEGVIEGARQSKKIKRERDSTPSEGSKRIKKKKKNPE